MREQKEIARADRHSIHWFNVFDKHRKRKNRKIMLLSRSKKQGEKLREILKINANQFHSHILFLFFSRCFLVSLAWHADLRSAVKDTHYMLINFFCGFALFTGYVTPVSTTIIENRREKMMKKMESE